MIGYIQKRKELFMNNSKKNRYQLLNKRDVNLNAYYYLGLFVIQ
jgi:hypothetical protein